MTAVQAQILKLLAEWPQRTPSSQVKIGDRTYTKVAITTIARIIGCHHGTVSRAVAQLDRDGLIARTKMIKQSAPLRPFNLYRLTATGRKYITKGKPSK